MGNSNGVVEDSLPEASSAFTSDSKSSSYTSAFAVPLGPGSASYSSASPTTAASTAADGGGGLPATDSPGAPKSILKNKVRFAPDHQIGDGGNTDLTLQNTNFNRGRKALDFTASSSSAVILGTKSTFQTMCLIKYIFQ